MKDQLFDFLFSNLFIIFVIILIIRTLKVYDYL